MTFLSYLIYAYINNIFLVTKINPFFHKWPSDESEIFFLKKRASALTFYFKYFSIEYYHFVIYPVKE